MATHADEIRTLRNSPGGQKLLEAFSAQVKSAGRAHHRKLLAALRAGVKTPATEPMQELALALKGKLRFTAPKPSRGKKPAAAKGEVFAYFPGCLTAESAREYDASIRVLARMLEVNLVEIDGWRCCGAGLGPAAAPAAAGEIVSGCPVCVARLREASPESKVAHVLSVLTRPVILEKLKAKIAAGGEKRPVGSLKVAPYYGCEVAAEAPAIETLMGAAGATVVKWDGRNRPSGGYGLFADPEAGLEMLGRIFRDFEKSGADAIVTACPHCHFNLDAFQFAIGRARKRALEVPILHFTEVLALAMNLDLERGLERHVTSALALIDRLIAEESKRRAAEARAEKKKAGS